MDEQMKKAGQQQRADGSLKAQLVRMPRWHKAVLSLALLLSAAGAAGWVVGQVGERAVQNEASAGQGELPPPPGASQFLPRTTDPSRPQEQVQPPPQPDQPFALRISPQMMRVGLSLLVGFMVGFLFRMFVKTMALVVLVIGGIVLALTYFNVVNVDLTAAQQTYESSRDWLTDQVLRLRDVVLAHVHSSASGAFGAFIGFRRK